METAIELVPFSGYISFGRQARTELSDELHRAMLSNRDRIAQHMPSVLERYGTPQNARQSIMQAAYNSMPQRGYRAFVVVADGYTVGVTSIWQRQLCTGGGACMVGSAAICWLAGRNLLCG